MAIDEARGSDVSVAELAEVVVADESAEQEETAVTVVVTVITQEAGQVRGHAAANGENAMTASTNARIEGDIVEYSR